MLEINLNKITKLLRYYKLIEFENSEALLLWHLIGCIRDEDIIEVLTQRSFITVIT